MSTQDINLFLDTEFLVKHDIAKALKNRKPLKAPVKTSQILIEYNNKLKAFMYFDKNISIPEVAKNHIKNKYQDCTFDFINSLDNCLIDSIGKVLNCKMKYAIPLKSNHSKISLFLRDNPLSELKKQKNAVIININIFCYFAKVDLFKGCGTDLSNYLHNMIFNNVFKDDRKGLEIQQVVYCEDAQNTITYEDYKSIQESKPLKKRQYVRRARKIQVLMPFYFENDGKKYYFTIEVKDLMNTFGKMPLKQYLTNVGLIHTEKNKLAEFDYDIVKGFEALPCEFMEYMFLDVYLLCKSLDAKIETFKDTLKDINLLPYISNKKFNKLAESRTLGTIVNKALLEPSFNKILNDDYDFHNDPLMLFNEASADYLANCKDENRQITSKIIGGDATRCNNKLFVMNGVDIDINSAYASVICFNALMFAGRPSYYTLKCTLHEFTKKHMNNYDDYHYVILTNFNLKKRKIDNSVIYETIASFDDEDHFYPDETTTCKNLKIGKDCVLTSLDVKRILNSNSELLHSVKVFFVYGYAKKDKCNSINEFMEERIKIRDNNIPEGTNLDKITYKERQEIKKQLKKAYGHKFVAFSLGDLFAKKVKEKRSFFKAIKDCYISQIKQGFLKLLNNGAYGVMVSRFFDTSNVITAHHITAEPRIYVQTLAEKLNLMQTITDGGCADLNDPILKRNLYGNNNVTFVKIKKDGSITIPKNKKCTLKTNDFSKLALDLKPFPVQLEDDRLLVVKTMEDMEIILKFYNIIITHLMRYSVAKLNLPSLLVHNIECKCFFKDGIFINKTDYDFYDVINKKQVTKIRGIQDKPIAIIGTDGSITNHSSALRYIVDCARKGIFPLAFVKRRIAGIHEVKINRGSLIRAGVDKLYTSCRNNMSINSFNFDSEEDKERIAKLINKIPFFGLMTCYITIKDGVFYHDNEYARNHFQGVLKKGVKYAERFLKNEIRRLQQRRNKYKIIMQYFDRIEAYKQLIRDIYKQPKK